MIEIISKVLSRSKSAIALKMLERDGDTDIRRLTGAIRAASSRMGAASDERWAAIERVRDTLLRSERIVLQQDFGAGEHGDARSPTGLHHGRTVERRIGDVCRSSSRPSRWCRVIFHLAKAFQPSRALEMGTCLGISGAYIAAALTGSGGRLITLEGAAAFAEIAGENFRRLGLRNIEIRQGPFSDTLKPALSDLEPVDFVFVDGHHDETATKAYFETILGHSAMNAVLVFDDIAWSDGMRRAWAYVRDHGSVRVSADLGPMGIVVLGTGRRRHISLPLS